MRPDSLVLVGVFGAPQGVRGEIRVKSFTADPKAIGAYGPLAEPDGARVFAFERLRGAERRHARGQGRGRRDARSRRRADRAWSIFAAATGCRRRARTNIIYADLVGLDAVTASGEPLGRVAGVSNYGAGDILEIAPEGGGETLLMPFTKAVVPTIDFESGRIVIEPPKEIAGEPEGP